MRCYKEKLTEFTQCETSHWVPSLCIFLRAMACMNVCHRKLVMSSPQTCTEFSHIVMQPVSATCNIEPKWNLTDVQCWQENYPSNSTGQCDTWALAQKKNAQNFTSDAFLGLSINHPSKTAPLSHTHKAQPQKCAHFLQFWLVWLLFHTRPPSRIYCGTEFSNYWLLHWYLCLRSPPITWS